MRRIDGAKKGKAIAVELDGDQVPAHEGEPVACALLAAGETTFARSIKYHRPRGPYCFAAACSHCLMRVDGVPNMYTCQIPARPGMRLERQNAYPSAKVDVFHSIDWLFPKGLDHHAMFAGVPVAEQVMAKVARHLAGLGLLPDKPAPARMAAEVLQIEVAIAGGGVSGLFAAHRLVEKRVPFLVLEREDLLGGRLHGAPAYGGDPGPVPAALPRGAVRMKTQVIGLYEDEGGWFFAAVSGENAEARLLKVYAQRFVVAVGGYPVMIPFENNELPGVYSGRAASLLLRRHGLLVADKPALVGRGDELYALAEMMQRAGAKLAAVVDIEGDPKGEGPAVHGTDLKAHGRGHVSAISFARKGRRKKVSCDAILVSVPPSPAFELARQGGARVAWSPEYQAFTVEADESGKTNAPRVFVCGELVGPRSVAHSARSGERVADAVLQERGA